MLCAGSDQLADLLTKLFSFNRFLQFRSKFNVLDVSAKAHHPEVGGHIRAHNCNTLAELAQLVRLQIAELAILFSSQLDKSNCVSN